jgi:hypothetical protein
MLKSTELKLTLVDPSAVECTIRTARHHPAAPRLTHTAVED